MAYNINLTDGTLFATVADGTTNTDSSLILIGKNTSLYGEILNENYIKLLESHALSTAPANPLTGQVWFDTSTDLLKVYDGTNFEPVGSLEVTISDGTNDHTVVEHRVGGTLVGITSADAEFTPSPAVTGFASIKPGYNLSTDIANIVFAGTATNASNAELLDSLDSSQFLRSDTNDSTTGTLQILNDLGVAVGAGNELAFSVTGNVAYITQTASNTDLIIQTNSGAITDVITIDGPTAQTQLPQDVGLAVGSATDLVLDISTGTSRITQSTTDTDLIIRANPGGTPTDVITVDGTTARARVSTPLAGTDVANKDYVDSAAAPVLFSGAFATLDVNITLPNSTWTTIPFATEVYDTDGIHDLVTNNSRFTVPAGASYVRLVAKMRFTANSTGDRTVGVWKNGSQTYPGFPSLTWSGTSAVNEDTGMLSSVVLPVVPGDYFELRGFQNSGVSLTARGDAGGQLTHFAMEIIE